MRNNPELIVSRPAVTKLGQDLNPFDNNGLDFWLNDSSSIRWIRTVHGQSVPLDPQVYATEYDVASWPHFAAFTFAGS